MGVGVESEDLLNYFITVYANTHPKTSRKFYTKTHTKLNVLRFYTKTHTKLVEILRQHLP